MPPLDHVDNITHEEARRPNIPTSEMQPLVPDEQRAPVSVSYRKRDPGLDPQLVWRGKYDGDETLAIKAPPLYIQEKIHPKALVEDLLKYGRAGAGLDEDAAQYQLNLFADFNGIPEEADRTDFYQHEQNWTNRMILGDSLRVMASLAEREGLRGKVQAIYIDPPYGIKFNSNFQWSTTSRDVKDGRADNFTREPEQVKAFRDTWADGIHSYLSYLRDRFIVARDLLTESGSIFVQIGDENVHHVRELLDGVFGAENYCAEIIFKKSARTSSLLLPKENDYILWHGKNKSVIKYNPIFIDKSVEDIKSYKYLISNDTTIARTATKQEILNPELIGDNFKLCQMSFIVSGDAGRNEERFYTFRNTEYDCGAHRHFKTSQNGLDRLAFAQRLYGLGSQLNYIRYFNDFPISEISTRWEDTGSAGYSNSDPKIYVVQTDTSVIQRCLLMATDPGDLVLDPTCGSGTTAYVAEQWGRRWITIDTSRVALALARARLMGARYPYYLMADTPEGAAKEAAITHNPPSPGPFGNNINHGFVYERVPHITLKAIANNVAIDEIWAKWQKTLGPLLEKLNRATGQSWEEWEVPPEAADPWPEEAAKLHATLGKAYRVKMPDSKVRPLLARLNEILGSSYKKIEHLPQKPATPWKEPALKLHSEWREARLARQKEIDASIAALAECEYLFDRPYEDKKRVRVAGPFTVESISPHRVLDVGPDDEVIDNSAGPTGEARDFVQMILENLATAGVQQAHKEGRLNFASLLPWPGELICAEGRYQEGEEEKRAAIFIGPEFGTVSRADLATAAREAAEAGFSVLVACGFNYDAQSADLRRIGSLPLLKARMNADLHMADTLKSTGKGNLFVVFGEPDIEIIQDENPDLVAVKLNGVDVYYPNSGEIRSDNAADIACWLVDSNYNGESFFVRQAYFLGQNDPYKALKTTLKAEINPEAWETLHKSVSRPFPRPETGQIAVKVINSLGDEVMKVFRV